MGEHVEPHERLVVAAVGASQLVEAIEHLGAEVRVRDSGMVAS